MNDKPFYGEASRLTFCDIGGEFKNRDGISREKF
jgi:hypothetical protein